MIELATVCQFIALWERVEERTGCGPLTVVAVDRIYTRVLTHQHPLLSQHLHGRSRHSTNLKTILEGRPGNGGLFVLLPGKAEFHIRNIVLYSRKYWWSLNLVVCPQTKHKKYWRNLNLAVAPRGVLCHRKHCMCTFISIAVLLFEVLELSREFANLQKI